MMRPEQEPLSPQVARSDQMRPQQGQNAGGPTSVVVHTLYDPAYQTRAHQSLGAVNSTAHPRGCLHADDSPDVPDYCSMCSICVLMVAIVLLFAFVPYVGVLFLIALLPTLLFFHCCYFSGARHSVRVNNAIRAFWLGILFAIPVALIEGLIVGYWNEAGGKGQHNGGENEEDNDRVSIREAIGAAIFLAFLIAFLETILKYLITRAMYNRNIFYTPFGLAVIGMAAGLGFATVENLLYIIMYGLITAAIRGVMTVPFQALTGIIIGSRLAQNKYNLHGHHGHHGQGAHDQVANPQAAAPGQAGFGAKPGVGAGMGMEQAYQPTHDPYYRPEKNHFKLFLSAIWLPMLLHFLFNFPLFAVTMTRSADDRWAIWQLGSLLILLITALVAYLEYRKLQAIKVYPPPTGAYGGDYPAGAGGYAARDYPVGAGAPAQRV